MNSTVSSKHSLQISIFTKFLDDVQQLLLRQLLLSYAAGDMPCLLDPFHAVSFTYHDDCCRNYLLTQYQNPYHA